MRKRRTLLVLVALALLLSLLIVRCSSSSDGPKPTADLSLIGTGCDKPGEIAQANGATFVCVSTKKKGGEAAPVAVYYGVAAEKSWRCDKLGETRLRDGVFSVCSGGSDRKKRKWVLTTPMPVSVAAFIDEADSTAVGALEQIGVPIPEEIANLPGMQEFAVESPTTAPATTAPVTTASVTTVVDSTTSPETVSPTVSDPETTSSAVPSTVTEVTTEGSVGGATTSSAAGTPTTGSSATTQAVVTTDSPASTQGSTTTESPASTQGSTTTESPASTQGSTTTESPASTQSPQTTVTVKTLPCAEGGKCVNGDVGPGGGIVVVVPDDSGRPQRVVEVAPVTWYLKGSNSADYAEKLIYGSKADWRLPSANELAAIRAVRNLFVCPQAKRCALGFANAPYWSDDDSGLKTVNFANDGAPQDASATASNYLRPVRTVQGTVG